MDVTTTSKAPAVFAPVIQDSEVGVPVTLVQGEPPISTVPVGSKSAPVIVIVVPPERAPALGAMPATCGGIWKESLLTARKP